MSKQPKVPYLLWRGEGLKFQAVNGGISYKQWREMQVKKMKQATQKRMREREAEELAKELRKLSNLIKETL